jgi:O-antigen/teichoic acid export membrane protein
VSDYEEPKGAVQDEIEAELATGEKPEKVRAGRKVAWGFADQFCSSLTNFGLTIIAGRALGPEALGVIALGFAAYVIALVFQRALITEPHTVVSAGLPMSERRPISRRTVTMSLLAGGIVAVFLLIMGAVLPGPVGKGFLLFAPWIPIAMVQDLWRFVLFRDGRNAAAVMNDFSWVVGMLITLPLALSIHTDWAMVGAWGFGALIGVVLGFWQTRLAPSPPAESWRWWRTDAWPIGKWFALDRAASNVGTQGTVFILAPLLGAAALGGLKATNSVFAPLSVLGPAITLPGLPAMTRAYRSSLHSARSLATRLSFTIGGLTGVYTLALALGGGAALTFLFGDRFTRFTDLIAPVATGQLLAAVGIGFIILLKASKRGRSLVAAHVISTVGTLIITPILAIRSGVTGAAWGLAIGYGLESVAVIWFALRVPRFASDETEVGPEGGDADVRTASPAGKR